MQTVCTRSELKRQLNRRLPKGESEYTVNGLRPNGEGIIEVGNVRLKVSPANKDAITYIHELMHASKDNKLTLGHDVGLKPHFYLESFVIKPNASPLQVNHYTQVVVSEVVEDTTPLDGMVFSVSDDRVATIDENGRLTGISEGTVVVSAELLGVRATVIVDVIPE